MSDQMPETAAEFFGSMHGSYDDLIKRCVPRYDEMLDRLLDHLPLAPRRVLELGCGTGNLTARLSARFPNAALVIADASPEMTQAASERVGGRVEPVVARFEDLSIAEASIDLVVSSISLHHVSDKALLYRDIKRWLAPGGEFWLADQFAGATEKIHQRNWEDWLTFCRRDEGCTEKEIEDLLEHASAHDHYTPVVVHFEMLRSAGFAPETLDCVWRNLIWGIIGARRL